MSNLYGYARVSTQDQTLYLQREKLQEAGCLHVWEEKLSGANADRPQLKLILKRLQRGDILLVTKLDRLARSMPDLFGILGQITAAGAHFRSLGDPGVDTTTAHGRLLLGILGVLAEFERHIILERTNEGRERARKKGVRFGRKPKLTEFQTVEMLARLEAGEDYHTVGAAYNMHWKSIARIWRQVKEKANAKNADGWITPSGSLDRSNASRGL